MLQILVYFLIKFSQNWGNLIKEKIKYLAFYKGGSNSHYKMICMRLPPLFRIMVMSWISFVPNRHGFENIPGVFLNQTLIWLKPPNKRMMWRKVTSSFCFMPLLQSDRINPKVLFFYGKSKGSSPTAHLSEVTTAAVGPRTGPSLWSYNRSYRAQDRPILLARRPVSSYLPPIASPLSWESQLES